MLVDVHLTPTRDHLQMNTAAPDEGKKSNEPICYIEVYDVSKFLMIVTTKNLLTY